MLSRFKDPIYVTRPLLPPFEQYAALTSRIFRSQQVTNGGPMAQDLEDTLRVRLEVPHLSLVSSGTAALILALKATMRAGSWVVTTPFTFPATSNAIRAAGMKPLFVDIDPVTMCLDPNQVEKALRDTTLVVGGILPVHVFGIPCDTEAFAQLSADHNVPVVYDAAHAFDVKVNGEQLSRAGAATCYSFHATKLFHTVEGGAVATSSPDIKKRMDLTRNHGHDGRAFQVQGINAKLSEFHAAMGLSVLPLLDAERKARAAIANRYARTLRGDIGLRFLSRSVSPQWSTPSLQYFPIRVFNGKRDLVHDELLKLNVHCRKYFWPLVTETPAYAGWSGFGGALPACHQAAKEILCLPFYGGLGEDKAGQIARAICDILARADRKVAPVQADGYSTSEVS